MANACRRCATAIWICRDPGGTIALRRCAVMMVEHTATFIRCAAWSTFIQVSKIDQIQTNALCSSIWHLNNLTSLFSTCAQNWRSCTRVAVHCTKCARFSAEIWRRRHAPRESWPTKRIRSAHRTTLHSRTHSRRYAPGHQVALAKKLAVFAAVRRNLAAKRFWRSRSW